MISEERRAYNRRYYLQHAEKLKADQRIRFSKIREKDNARRRAHYASNAESNRQKAKIYAASHREDRRKYSREYYLKNQLKFKEYRRNYIKQNRDKVNLLNATYAKRNPEKVRKWTANWKRNNPDKVAAADARRRAREMSAITDTAAVDHFFRCVRNQDVVTCTYCERPISGQDIHIEHIVPLVKGGPHVPDNLAVSCKPCNSSKCDHLLSEWKRCPDRLKPLLQLI